LLLHALDFWSLIVGASLAAGGYGAGRSLERGRGFRQEAHALVERQAALQSRIDSLDDALSDAMRQSMEGRAEIDRRVQSDSAFHAQQLSDVRQRFERLEARSGAVDQRLVDLADGIDRYEKRQQQMQTVWQQVDQELKQMQAFIVQTAQDVSQQRRRQETPVKAAPAMQESTAERGAELNTMIQDLAAAQAEFMARRQQEAL